MADVIADQKDNVIKRVFLCFDMIEYSENEDEKSHYLNLVEILTPIVKSYSSDR